MAEQGVPRRPFRALRWRLLRAQGDLYRVTGEEPSPVSGTQEAAEGGLTGKEESFRVLLRESISHRKHIVGRERERALQGGRRSYGTWGFLQYYGGEGQREARDGL